MKTNSNWVKDLVVRAKTIKLLEENIGINHHGFGNRFLNLIPKGQAVEEKNRSLNFIRINFCTLKNTIKKVKSQHTKWEQIFANHLSK